MGKKHTIEDYKEVGVLFKQTDEMIGDLIVKTSKFGKTKYCRPLEKAHSIINKNST